MPATQTDHCIDVCNRLLRGEISAIETFNQAIEKFSDEPEVAMLKEMRSEHINSANQLRKSIHGMGGQPSQDSGAWGTWAKAIEGAATLMGDVTALKALQEGEEHGENEYRRALDDGDVLAGCKEMIRVDLLPRISRHISTLRGLRKAQ